MRYLLYSNRESYTFGHTLFPCVVQDVFCPLCCVGCCFSFLFLPQIPVLDQELKAVLILAAIGNESRRRFNNQLQKQTQSLRPLASSAASSSATSSRITDVAVGGGPAASRGGGGSDDALDAEDRDVADHHEEDDDDDRHANYDSDLGCIPGKGGGRRGVVEPEEHKGVAARGSSPLSSASPSSSAAASASASSPPMAADQANSVKDLPALPAGRLMRSASVVVGQRVLDLGFDIRPRLLAYTLIRLLYQLACSAPTELSLAQLRRGTLMLELLGRSMIFWKRVYHNRTTLCDWLLDLALAEQLQPPQLQQIARQDPVAAASLAGLQTQAHKAVLQVARQSPKHMVMALSARLLAKKSPHSQRLAALQTMDDLVARFPVLLSPVG